MGSHVKRIFAYLASPSNYTCMMESRDNLAKNLKALMDYHKVNQSDIYRKTGISQSSIGRILRKDNAPDLDTVGKIAEVFHLAGWQLISPPFSPDNPPVINQVSAKERELYERLRALAQETKNTG